MPNSIEDKISLFTKVIIERIELDCKRKQSKLVDYYENRKKKITDEYEEQKRQILERVKKDAETKKQQLILKNRSDMHLSVLKKKQEFSERLTDKVKSRIKSFIVTEEYAEFLKKAIKQVLTIFSDSQFIIFNFSKKFFYHSIRDDYYFFLISSILFDKFYFPRSYCYKIVCKF